MYFSCISIFSLVLIFFMLFAAFCQYAIKMMMMMTTMMTTTTMRMTEFRVETYWEGMCFLALFKKIV